MTMIQPRRKDKGVAGPGGLWVAKENSAAAGFDLAGDQLESTLRFHELATDRFPTPQANDIEKILTAVDAIRAGANTPDAVALALGNARAKDEHTDRQGRYYADAAGYLGLVDRIAGADYVSYEVTDTGAALADATAERRVEAMTRIISQVPEIALYAEIGAEGLTEHLEKTYAESTADRRASTYMTWARTLERRDLSFVFGTEMFEAQDRIIAAVERAEADREARIRANRVVEPEICMDCFMAKSVSGECAC